MSHKKGKKKETVKVEKKEEKIEAIEVKEVKASKSSSKRKSIFVYFLMMLGVFALLDIAMMFITSDLFNMVSYYKYGKEIISELFYAILVLVVMLLFKNAYVFTTKQERLTRALVIAAPLLMFSTITLIINVVDLSLNNPTVMTTQNIISLLIFCLLIGITEEFLCRGWLQNEFLERYGDTKKNVITSIILASFIFGIMHIFNVVTTSQNIFETLLQIINAMSLGFLLGTLYYKTRNIWAVIILHGFYDFSIMLGELAMVKDCTYGVATPKIIAISSLSVFMLSAFWLLSAALILKRCNFPDVKADLSRSKLRDFYLLVLPLLAFTFIFSVIPFENMVDDFNDYYICYHYDQISLDKNYTLHTPVYDKYTIKHDSSKSSYVINDDKVNEVISIGNYNFELFLKDGMAVIKNVNTGVESKLHDDLTYDLIVIENEDNYFIAIVTMDKNGNENVYISDFMTKDNLSNADSYVTTVAESMRRLDLPEVDMLRYLTYEGNDEKYPAFTSSDHDLFVIVDNELFMVK